MQWSRGSPKYLLTHYCFSTGALGTIDSGEQAVDFLLDTEATYSVLNTNEPRKVYLKQQLLNLLVNYKNRC